MQYGERSPFRSQRQQMQFEIQRQILLRQRGRCMCLLLPSPLVAGLKVVDWLGNIAIVGATLTLPPWSRVRRCYLCLVQ